MHPYVLAQNFQRIPGCSPVSIISFTVSSNLADILELFNDVTKSHFKMLGLQLGLLLPTLEQIEQACISDEFGIKVIHKMAGTERSSHHIMFGLLVISRQKTHYLCYPIILQK